MEQVLTIDINSDELASNFFLGEHIYCDFGMFRFRDEYIKFREYELDIMNRFVNDVHTPEYLRGILLNNGLDIEVRLIPESIAPEFKTNIPVKCQITVPIGDKGW